MCYRKLFLITSIVLLFSGCHSLTIINDTKPTQESAETFNETAHLYHFYVGFLDFDNQVTNLCKKADWSKIYIHRENENLSLETGSDVLLFTIMFGTRLVFPSVLMAGAIQTVEGSPMIYKNTSVSFTCNWL